MLHWSPLIAKRDAATGRVITLDRIVDPSTGAKTYRVADKGEQVPRRNQFLVPDPKRKGRNWQHFVDHLRRLGGNMQWRVIKNADLGAHSTRERLYAVIRFDGEPITWPELTHSKNGTGGKKKWRPAADCIDWTIQGRSIFGRDKPLAPATMRRIAHGMRKYVLESPDPFIMPATHTDASDRTRSLRDPMPTVTAANRGELMLAAPTLVPVTHSRDTAFDVRDPLRTITTAKGGETALAAATLVALAHSDAGRRERPAPDLGAPLSAIHAGGGNHAIAAAHLVQVSYGERKGQEPRALDPLQPLGTVVAGGIKHAVATACLVQAGHGEGSGPTKRRSKGAKDARDPLGTVTASGSGGHATATAFMVQANGGFNEIPARDLRAPMSTITTSGSQQQLITAHLTTLRKHSVGRDARDPMTTVSAGGEHQALVEYHLSEEDEAGALRCAAFLMRYHSTGGQWADLRDPATTVTTHDRLALVTVWLHGKPFVIVDICLRMLVPRELYNAQDFPPTYEIARTSSGKVLTKTAQVRMCGNSVSPLPMSLIVGLNYGERRALREAA
jgi:DNA (cytosine-5)-methyltransferase 1